MIMIIMIIMNNQMKTPKVKKKPISVVFRAIAVWKKGAEVFTCQFWCENICSL